MIKRNLITNPCWSAKDLGQALPNSPHAVSVALPRWQDVIDYEEKKPSCIDSLKSIYPRFGFNPLIQEVVKKALSTHSKSDYNAWPYPDSATAQKAKDHCKRFTKGGEILIREVLGLYCLITDADTTPAAKAFWQHTGLGASSRLAAIALGKEPPASQAIAKIARGALEKRLANIYGCNSESIQLHPSGMAAFTSALEIVTKLRPKSPTLQIGFPYVDVLKLPQVVFEGSNLFLNTEPTNLAKELDSQKPSAVVVELPSNPMLQCINLPEIAKLSHERGIPVIADDTIGSAININALPFADIVFSSLTKSFAGRGDILAGSLVVSPHSFWFNEFSKSLKDNFTTPLSDADTIALEEASRDVHIRIPKLNQACHALKTKLESHPAVARVLHPGECQNFKSIMRSGAGYGCLLSFELIGGLNKAKKVYDALEVCKGPSLGTNFTLTCPYVLLAHYEELNWARECGVPSHLLRVSVGLEKHEELWSRFERALKD